MFLGHWSWWHQCPIDGWTSDFHVADGGGLSVTLLHFSSSQHVLCPKVTTIGTFKCYVQWKMEKFNKIFSCIFWLYIYVLLTGKMVDVKNNYLYCLIFMWRSEKKSLFHHGWSVACKNIVDSKATNLLTSTLLAWVRAHERYITGVLFPACCTSPCGRLFCPSSYNCSHIVICDISGTYWYLWIL